MNKLISRYEDSYLEIIITISCFWMCLTYIPFFIPIRNWILLIDSILFIPVLIKKKDYKLLLGFNKFFAALLVLSVLSVLVTNSISNIAVWETILLSAVFYLFTGHASEEARRNVLRNIFIITNIVTLLSLFLYFIVLFTDLENSSNYTIAYSLGNVLQGGRLSGITASFNILGPMAMVSCLFSIFFIIKSKSDKKAILTHVLLILLNIYIWYLTDCRSAIVAFVAAIYVGTFFCLPTKKRKIFLVCFVIIGGILALLLILSLPLLSQLTGRDWVTGSGRSAIFKQAMTLVLKEKPLFGFGEVDKYLSAAQNVSFNELGSVVGTHNMYIEVAALFGIPALIFYFLSILSVLLGLIICYLKNIDMRKNRIVLPAAIFAFMLVFELFEHHGIFKLTPMIIYYMLAYFMLDASCKRAMKNI